MVNRRLGDDCPPCCVRVVEMARCASVLLVWRFLESAKTLTQLDWLCYNLPDVPAIMGYVRA